MNVVPTPIPGLLLIKPQVFGDERGFFLESYQRSRFVENGIPLDFVQDNHSRSTLGVVRGLHYTIKRPQAQTVYVSNGKIFDVAVDLRRNSPTFGRGFGVIIDGDDPSMLYLPPGFAHGFCVLSARADVHYKVTHVYEADDEAGLYWNDPVLGVDWPVTDPSLKARDAAFPLLADIPSDRLPQVGFVE